MKIVNPVFATALVAFVLSSCGSQKITPMLGTNPANIDKTQ